MELKVLLLGLRLALSLFEVNSVVALDGSQTGLTQRTGPTEAGTDGVSTQTVSMKCNLQVTARLPAFSKNGDYVIGGVFSIHFNTHTAIHNYTTMPEPSRCTGRLVRGGTDGGRMIDLYEKNLNFYNVQPCCKIFYVVFCQRK